MTDEISINNIYRCVILLILYYCYYQFVISVLRACVTCISRFDCCCCYIFFFYSVSKRPPKKWKRSRRDRPTSNYWNCTPSSSKPRSETTTPVSIILYYIPIMCSVWCRVCVNYFIFYFFLFCISTPRREKNYCKVE